MTPQEQERETVGELKFELLQSRCSAARLLLPGCVSYFCPANPWGPPVMCNMAR